MSNYMIFTVRDGWLHCSATPVIYANAREAIEQAKALRVQFPATVVKVLRLVDDVERDPQDYVAKYHEARERQRQQRAREQNDDPNR